MLLLIAAMLALPADACVLQPSEHEALLAQDWYTFDQSADGFRTLVSGERYCPLLAAELIVDYLERHRGLSTSERYVSEFHAGQQFAGANDVGRALPHFYRGFNPDEDPDSSNRWNAYVRATIAFLEQDRLTLEASLKVLEAHEDNRMNAINLRMVRGFAKNVGRTYNEAVEDAFND